MVSFVKVPNVPAFFVFRENINLYVGQVISDLGEKNLAGIKYVGIVDKVKTRSGTVLRVTEFTQEEADIIQAVRDWVKINFPLATKVFSVPTTIGIQGDDLFFIKDQNEVLLMYMLRESA